MVLPSRTLTVSIDVPTFQVYRYVADPSNLPKWARALCQGVHRSGNKWTVETALGPMGFRFVDINAFGVLDHIVSLGDGVEVLNYVRAVVNGDGTELMFTLMQGSGTSDEEFDKDCRLVARDLAALKDRLESEKH